MSFSLRTPPLSLSFPTRTQPRRTQTNKFPCFSTGKPRKGDNNKINGPEQSVSDQALEAVQRMKTQLEERENAMKNSKKLIFSDLCKYLCLEAGEVKSNWGKMNPDEKLGLIQGFVSDWGLRFHPLSIRSVRDLVDEFVAEDENLEKQSSDLVSISSDFDDDSGSDSGVIFPGLKKFFMGFTQVD